MIIVAGTMTVRPDALETLRSMIVPHGQQTMLEPGCIRFSLGIANETTGEVTVLEIWRDEAALALHHTQPFTREFVDRLGNAILGLDLTVYDVAGMRPLPEFDTLTHVPS